MVAFYRHRDFFDISCHPNHVDLAILYGAVPADHALKLKVSDSADQSWMLKPEDVANVVAQILTMPTHALTYQVEVRAAKPRKN